MKKSLMFISIGAEISSLIVASILLGRYLDERFSTRGLFMIGFVVLSFAGWLIRLMNMLKQKNNKGDS